MLRFACLLLVLVLSAGPAPCLAADAMAEPAAAPGAARCKAKAGETPAAEAAAPADAPSRNSEAAPARTGDPARSVRSANPRWNRLLPGMFR